MERQCRRARYSQCRNHAASGAGRRPHRGCRDSRLSKRQVRKHCCGTRFSITGDGSSAAPALCLSSATTLLPGAPSVAPCTRQKPFRGQIGGKHVPEPANRPSHGAIIPLFQPPAGISPALANHIRDWGFGREKWRAFTAAALSLAVRGLLRFDDRSSTLTLTRIPPARCRLARIRSSAG